MQEFLIQEIFEQSAIIQKLITNQFSEIQSIARHLKNKYKYIVIAARGSSDNAARYAQYVLGVFNNNQVALATPSVYTIYKKPPGLTGALVIGISQSGQSPDIVSVLESAKQQGQPTLCITNDEKSPLAMTSDYVIPIQVGKEYSVAATKTYTASLTALAMLSIGLQNDKERSGELMLLPETIDNLLPELKETADGASRYRYMEHCVVIGRGFNYSTAFEIALKVKELTRVVAVPYSSADFKHGPIATVHTGFPVIVIASSGPMYAHIKKFTGNLIKMGAEIIAISDKKEFTSLGKLSFKMPSNVPEWLSPITNVIPGQLFARKLAAEKELNVDKPEGLSKITETY